MTIGYFLVWPLLGDSNRCTIIVVVVLTLTHRHNTMQSVVADGQAAITLEWKKYL